MQTVHFVFSYFFAKNGNENCEQVEIAVPTGAAGNITGQFNQTILVAKLIIGSIKPPCDH
jgi:hypothetical protein